MIDVAIVEWGPEVRLTRARQLITRLRSLLKEHDRSEAEDGVVEFVFILGGSLGEPDFEGVRRGKFSRAERRVQIHLAVSRETTQLDHPEQALLLAVVKGVGLAGQVFRKARIPYREREQLAGIVKIAQMIGRHEDHAVIAQAAREKGRTRRPRKQDALTSSPQTLEIWLRRSDGETGMPSLHRLEDELAELAAARDAGALNGNEISAEWVTLFFESTDADALAQIVLPSIKAKAPSESYVVIREPQLDGDERRTIRSV